MPHHYKQFAMEAVHPMPLHMHPAQRINRMHHQYWLLNPMLTPGGGVNDALQQSGKQPQGRTARHGLIGPPMTTISAGIFLDQESAPRIGSPPRVCSFCRRCRWMRISGTRHGDGAFWVLCLAARHDPPANFQVWYQSTVLYVREAARRIILFHPPSSDK